jgi:DNA processing protein
MNKDNLIFHGNLDLLNKEKIAIVGSRNVSSEGIRLTKNLSLLSHNKVIIHGNARGVDSIAEYYSNESIIVLPCKYENSILTKFIKKLNENKVLLIYEKDSLVWSVKNAMARNKIIADLSDKVYLVESLDNKGGSYNMGKYCIDNKIPLYTVNQNCSGSIYFNSLGAIKLDIT